MDLRTNNINEVMFGFFMDQTDGTTERNSETIANSDIRIHKYQASAFADKHSGGASFISNATYIVRLDSTDVNTPGPLKIICHKTSCLPVMMEFNVLTEAAWANKYGTPLYATNSMLTSTQTNVDSVLGTLNSVKLMTSATYTYGALTSRLTSVQTVVDSVLGTTNSVKAMTSATYTYGALTSQLTSVQSAVASIPADVWSVATRTLTDSIATLSDIWEYTTRALTDSVARASQLTSVQVAVDSAQTTLGSMLLQTSEINTYVARASQLTSVQLAVDAGGATITPSDVWGYSVKALTDSVARTSQLTSVQLVVDAGGAGVTTSQIWEYSDRQLTESVAVNTWAVATRSLTDSVARASQLTSVQTVVDSALGTVNSVKAMTSNTYTYGALTSQLTSVQVKADSVAVVLGSMYASLAIMSNPSPADVWAVGTRALTDSVARASQLTSVQAVVDSTYQISGSVLASLTVMSNLSAADMWAVGTRSLTDSVARTSQLTSVQLVTDSVLGTTNSLKIMASATYSFGALTSQLTSVQTKVDTLAAGGDATLANQTSILLHLTDIKGATWAAATDSLEAIRDRGDAAWITGAGLTGANTVTLTIKDDSALNVVQAGVCVYDSAGTTFYEKKFSNASGQTTFQMDDGTYKIKVNKAGYSWTDTTLIVAGATTQTITGTASVITPPADPTLCRIGIYMKYQDGTIPATVESKLEIVELPDVHGNIGYMGTAYDGTYSATTGFLYWDVIQGAIAKLYILDAGIDGTKITIPATATAEIEDLI